jgi:NAD(P)-dependent dehydrogenase (short-subunit alcohol dehydrogenase family)
MELPRTPSSRLDGRRALVTGAGRGIGLACAAALAQAGAHVVLAARTTSEIDEVAGSIRLDDGTAESITLDITDINATTDAIAGLEAFS